MGIKKRKKYLLFQPLIILLCVFLSHIKRNLNVKRNHFYTQSSQYLIIITFREIKPFSFFFTMALCADDVNYMSFLR